MEGVHLTSATYSQNHIEVLLDYCQIENLEHVSVTFETGRDGQLEHIWYLL